MRQMFAGKIDQKHAASAVFQFSQSRARIDGRDDEKLSADQ